MKKFLILPIIYLILIGFVIILLGSVGCGKTIFIQPGDMVQLREP
jgi:hypothetical protein